MEKRPPSGIFVPPGSYELLGALPEENTSISRARALRVKAHALRNHEAHDVKPSDPLSYDLFATTLQIESNIDQQSEPGSQARGLFREAITGKQDIFKAPLYAGALVDLFLHGVDGPDWVDVVQVTYKYSYFIDKALPPAKDDDAREERIFHFSKAFYRDLIQRLSMADFDATADPIVNLFDRIYTGVADAEDMPTLRHVVNGLEIWRKERKDVWLCITEGNLFPVPKGKTVRGWVPHAYNRPLPPEQRTALDGNAAEVIERLHLLKEYPISSLIVPGQSVALPWDVAIMPPLEKNMEVCQDGAIADFLLLAIRPDRTSVLYEHAADLSNDAQTLMNLSGEVAALRLRLFDDGQLVSCASFDIIPGNATERSFADMHSQDAFAKLRALFIAIAFDSMVPDDVVRERVGGSVASQYNELLQQSPGQNPLITLLLRRQKELHRAGVSPRKRQPANWPEAPKRGIKGYCRPLPEGTRRRATAEEEARCYYEDVLKRKFEGLRDDENFVNAYERRVPPERAEFRRAAFRRSSATVHALGGLGIGPRGGKRRGNGGKCRGRGKKR